MKISNGLKKVIFKKLYEDLYHVEIIPYKKSIWFIDRENKYWYFEYDLNGTLFWRHPFFNSFFKLFSLESDDYTLIISEWVEEVLNCKVLTTGRNTQPNNQRVEEVLNCKVLTTTNLNFFSSQPVEEVLNYKVLKTEMQFIEVSRSVEEVLNYKVKKTELTTFISEETIKNALEYSVPEVRIPLEEVLNDNGQN